MKTSFKEFLVLRETSQYGLFDDEDDFEHFEESAKSDKYELSVAEYVSSIPEVTAIRPKVGADYSDIIITYKGKEAWMEVKMNHTDNLSNPRVFYKDGKWKTTYTTPVAQEAVKILNDAPFTKNFINEISTFSKIPIQHISIPTTIGGLKDPNAVSLDIMKKYFSQPGKNRYIVDMPDCDLGEMITLHYTEGKTKPAYYMQAGDDFYRISNKDPFKFGSEIPLLSGTGSFKMRIGTRSKFYEVQAEIKIKKLPNSLYSLKPGTKKKNPFLLLAQKAQKVKK